MKRLWTVIAVADVARSLGWYQSPRRLLRDNQRAR